MSDSVQVKTAAYSLLAAQKKEEKETQALADEVLTSFAIENGTTYTKAQTSTNLTTEDFQEISSGLAKVEAQQRAEQEALAMADEVLKSFAIGGSRKTYT